MAKYLVETFYTCTFKVSHYLDKIDEKELSERKKNWKPLSKDEEKGVLSKYADSVASASKGAVTT